MAKGITLKTKNGATGYPKSVTDLIFDNATGKTLKTLIDELKAIDAATDTRTQFYKASVTDLDALNAAANIGTYNYVGNGWRGLVQVCLDHSSNVAQVALSSSSPSYDGNVLSWLAAQPCSMARVYRNGAWSHWEKVGAPVVNDLTTGGTDKALSAEMGKTLKEGLDALGPEIYKESDPTTLLLTGTRNRIISDGVIASSDNNGQFIWYAAVSKDDRVHITATNDALKAFRYGFCDETPDVDVELDDAGSVSSTSVDLSFVAPYNGYIVINHSELYFTNHKVDVTTRTSRLDEIEDAIDDAVEDIGELNAAVETISQSVEEAVEAAEDVENIKNELHGLNADLLEGLTPSTGKYYGSSSGSITTTDNDSSRFYAPIDIEGYIGKTILLSNSVSASGTRLIAITTSAGYIIESYSETWFKNNGNQVNLTIPTNAKYLYVSYKDGSTVTSKVLQATPATFYTKSEVDSMLRGIASEIVYVSTSGSDSNDGTLANPLATIQEAVKKAKVVVLLGGVYEQGQIDLSLASSNEITITTQKDSRVILFGGSKILESEGTAHGTYSDVKVASISNYSDTKHWLYQYGVVDATTEIGTLELTPYHKRRSHRCEHTCLTRVSSIQAVSESDVPAFFYDNGTLYYKTTTEVSSTNFLFAPNGTLFSNTTNFQITMLGVDVVGKSINLVGVFNATISDCSAGYTLGNGAFVLDDSKNVTLQRCEALRNEKGVGESIGDGINAHSTGVNLSKILNVFTTFSLVDCWSHDNYNDGYSDHEGCVGNIKGGLFEHNCLGGHGAGLTPALGASDTIIGAIVQGNLYDGIQLHSSGINQSNAEYGTLYVEGCVSRNNTRDGFIFTAASNCGDFVNCMAYGNGRNGFNCYTSTNMRLVNCKAGSNGGTDITSGCVKILCD